MGINRTICVSEIGSDEWVFETQFHGTLTIELADAVRDDTSVVLWRINPDTAQHSNARTITVGELRTYLDQRALESRSEQV